MQKRASPNKHQAEIIRRGGLDPDQYTVVRELKNILIVRYRITGTVLTVKKCL